MLCNGAPCIPTKCIIVRDILNISATLGNGGIASLSRLESTNLVMHVCVSVSVCLWICACCMFLRKIWNKHCNISLAFIRWMLKREGEKNALASPLSLCLRLLSITFRLSVSVCVLARINMMAILLSLVSHWLAIPSAYDTASGCTKLHMFRIQITRYYEFMVKMFKTIYIRCENECDARCWIFLTLTCHTESLWLFSGSSIAHIFVRVHFENIDNFHCVQAIVW